jgi:hypothetical protein
MQAALTVTAATESLLGKGLLVPLGGIAALLALLGMALLVPIFLNQRREIARLTGWMNHEPDAGTTEFRAITPPTRATSPAADRVTSDRPALERIGTAEQRAVRAIERGPRHPLLIAIVALLVAVAIFFAVGHFLRAGDDDGGGNPIDPSTVSVVVLNASTSSGLAGEVADELGSRDFDVIATSVANGGSGRSIVRYADGQKRQAKLVARSLGIEDVKPFDREAQAAANEAEVVAFVGDDVARAGDGKG